MQTILTPNLTCNDSPVDLTKGIWFEVAVDQGEEEGTKHVYRTDNLADALKVLKDLDTEHPKFMDAWAFPVDDHVPYPIDQFSFEEKK